MPSWTVASYFLILRGSLGGQLFPYLFEALKQRIPRDYYVEALLLLEEHNIKKREPVLFGEAFV